jgi:hypothetical protein
MPTGIVLAGLVVLAQALLGVVVVLLVGFCHGLDRKYLLEHGEASLASTDGRTYLATPVTFSGSREEAIRLAAQALSAMRAKDLCTVDESTVVGWVGTMWLNVPAFEAHELAVQVVSRGSSSFTHNSALRMPTT